MHVYFTDQNLAKENQMKMVSRYTINIQQSSKDNIIQKIIVGKTEENRPISNC